MTICISLCHGSSCREGIETDTLDEVEAMYLHPKRGMQHTPSDNSKTIQ